MIGPGREARTGPQAGQPRGGIARAQILADAGKVSHDSSRGNRFVFPNQRPDLKIFTGNKSVK
jgi:hypothetical protein